MSTEQLLCCTTPVAVGQRAFSNYNGIGISLAYSPQAPSAAQLSRGPAPPSHQLQPPPMLAVVLDVSMQEGLTRAALQALTQALAQLNPQTRLLLLLVDQVVSVVDLKTSRPQSWVVHSLGGQGPAQTLPQLVQAADIRATPLAHCQPYLASSLASLQHYPRQHQSLQHHLRIMGAAADIALFLLTASMAAWDAQHNPQQQQQQQGPQEQQQQQWQQPLHNTRVMVLTGLPNSSCSSAAAAAEQLRQLDDQAGQQIRSLYHALANKAASLDIPIDVITGSIAAPAALLLQEAADVSQGRVLHQPQLQAPLALNIAAIAQSRFGWEGVLDVKVPTGVKLVSISGPIAHSEPLPQAAYLSGTPQLPVTLLTPQKAGAAAAAAAAAAASKAAADGGGGADAAAAVGGAASSSAAVGQAGTAAAAGAAVPETAPLLGPGGSSSSSGAAGPMRWSDAAVAVPVLSVCTRFVVALELSRDWPAGSSFDVQLVCEWTAVDGRRVRQVLNQPVHISDRLGPFMDALDVPAVVLLTSQRLVAAAAAAISRQGGSSGSSGLRLAAEPPKHAVDEARLSIGMTLAHVAQRMGHAHLSRRGLFGFGSQQVWQLPDALIPLALSFYGLQRGPLISTAAALAADEDWLSSSGSGNSSSNSSSQDGTTVGLSGSRQGGVPQGGSHQGVSTLMAGSWRLLMQQFMQCSPGTALRMVAPWLYVYDAGSNHFDIVPPLNLALEPDALAVLDCGSEVIIYVGKVLMALVEGLPTPSAADGGGNSSSSSSVPQPPQQQQGQLPQQQQGQPGVSTTAQAGSNGLSSNAAAGGASSRPPALAPVPDIAEAAAPAVRCAQALVRGRVPVPAVHIVEDTAGMVRLVQRLVPLHEDPVALQLLLLPHLNDISPMQHGYLLDWHKHWAGLAAAAAQQQQQAAGGYAGVRGGGGGARLAKAEAVKGEELSFGSWYSSFGVVLKSPGGALARGAHNLEVE